MHVKSKSKIANWVVSEKQAGTFCGTLFYGVYIFFINCKDIARSLFRKIAISCIKLKKIITRQVGYTKLRRNSLLLKGGPVKDINRFEATLFSQCGEDGILDAIFSKIGTTNKYFVEFGVQNGTECNTRFLRQKRGWSGLMMDGRDNNPEIIKQEFITAENINDLFKKYEVPGEFDLLSIDIDGNDYWVWKAIDESYSPRVVVMEYNSSVLPNESKTIEYEPDFVWDHTDYFGASLLALVKLAKMKGYTLVGCNNLGTNAFFVRDDEIKDSIILKEMQQLYRPPRFKTRKEGFGHPPSNRQMIEV